MALEARAVIYTLQRALGQFSERTRSYHASDGPYRKYIAQQLEAQGATPTLEKNARLRAQLELAENALFSQRPVFLLPRSGRSLSVVLGNADVLTVDVNPATADLAGIAAESLVGSQSFSFSAWAGAARGSLYALLLTSSQLLVVQDRRVPGKRNAILVDLPVPAPGVTQAGARAYLDVNQKMDSIVVAFDKNVLVYSVTYDPGGPAVLSVELAKHLRVKGTVVACEFRRKHAAQLFCAQERGPGSESAGGPGPGGEPADDSRRVELLNLEIAAAAEPVKRREVAKVRVPAGVRAVARSEDETLVAIGCEDGTLLAYNALSGALFSRPGPFAQVSVMRWHPGGALLLVGFENGALCFVDPALNVVPGPGGGPEVLRLTEHLSYAARMVAVEWLPDDPSAATPAGAPDPAAAPSRIAVVAFDRGPLAAVRAELGALSRGVARPAELLCSYLASGLHAQAGELCAAVAGPDEAALCASILADSILAGPAPLPEAARDRLSRAIRHALAAAPSEGRVAGSLRAIQRRFLAKLLEGQQLHDAFDEAHNLHAPDGYMDVARWAFALGEGLLGEVAWGKATALLAPQGDLLAMLPRPQEDPSPDALAPGLAATRLGPGPGYDAAAAGGVPPPPNTVIKLQR